VIAPKAMPQSRPQPRVYENAREAARKRGRRTKMQGYSMLARIATIFAVVLVPVMIYVLLMGNLTALNYSLAHATQQKIDLQEETMRLDDRIAQLQSRERLAALANKLHFHDPHVYAVVEVPGPVAAPPSNGIAFLGALFHH
jgi:cell division protein FtsL